MQQVTTIQRLEAEIQQIRAEGRLSSHDDSSDLPEYGSPRDLTNRVVDVPPNYGEAGINILSIKLDNNFFNVYI